MIIGVTFCVAQAFINFLKKTNRKERCIMYSPKKNKWSAFLALALVTALMLTGCGKGKASEVAPSDISEETPVVGDLLTNDDHYFYHWQLSQKEQIFDGSFRSQLPDEEKQIYDAIYQHIIVEGRTDDLTIKTSSWKRAIGEAAMCHYNTAFGERDGESFVDIFDDGLVKCAYDAFRDDNPKADGVQYEGCQCAVWDGKVDLVTIRFKELYKGAFDEMKTVYDNVDKTVEEIKGSRKSESRYDTLVAIHDYMCTHLRYSHKSLNGFTGFNDFSDPSVEVATPMFGGGNAKGRLVCGGYATAFKLLCVEFDIPCYTVYGQVSILNEDPISPGHVWNYVQMENGEWYGVDMTWDDAYEDAFGTQDYTYFLGGVSDGYLPLHETFSYKGYSDSMNVHLPQEAGNTFDVTSVLHSVYNEDFYENQLTYSCYIPEKVAENRYVP